jgi:hypothetical protein
MRIEIGTDTDLTKMIKLTQMYLRTSEIQHLGARYSALDKMDVAFMVDPFLRASKEAMIEYIKGNNCTKLSTLRWVDEQCEKLTAEFGFDMEGIY